MRMSGTVNGAPTTVATRMSVMRNAEGSEARLTLAWTKSAAASAAASPVSAMLPAAERPSVLKKVRRSSDGVDASISFLTAGFIDSLR